MNYALLFFAVLGWFFSGFTPSAIWWRSKFGSDTTAADYVVLSIAGVIFGPLAFLFVWAGFTLGYNSAKARLRGLS